MPSPRRPRPAPVQPDLLDSPPGGFEEAQVRAASLAGRISRAVAVTLRDCELSRAEIAARMGAFLGERVSEAMVNAYASAAREDHNISAVRLLALVHATGDVRLLHLLVEPFGLTPVPVAVLPLIELARVHESMEAMRRRADALRRSVRPLGRIGGGE